MPAGPLSGYVELPQDEIVNGDWVDVTDMSDGSSGSKKLNVNAFVWTHKDSIIKDGIFLKIGDAGDLLGYHDGTDSYLSNRTGDFIFRHTGTIVGGNILYDQNSHGFKHIFTAEDAGGVNTTPLTLDPDGVGGGGPEVVVSQGVIQIKEQAAAHASAATFGQVWIKNTTPCELWFTDDAGNDTKLA